MKDDDSKISDMEDHESMISDIEDHDSTMQKKSSARRTLFDKGNLQNKLQILNV